MNCNYQNVINNLHQGSPSGTSSLQLSPIRLLDLEGQPIMAQHKPADLRPPAMDYYDQQVDLARAAHRGIHAWLMQKPYLPLLETMIRDAFAADSPEQLQRFESLLAAVLEGLASAVDADAVTSKVMQLPLIEQLTHLSTPPNLCEPGRLASIDADVRKALIYMVVMPLKRNDDRLGRCVEEGFNLEESAEYRKKREEIETQEQRLQHAMSILEAIKPSPTPSGVRNMLIGPYFTSL